MRQNEHEFDEVETLRDEVKSLKGKYERLKGTYDRVLGGVIGVAFLVTGYLGFTTFFQVPSVVRSVVPNAVEKAVPEAVNDMLPDAINSYLNDYFGKDVSRSLDELQRQAQLAVEKANNSAIKADAILQEMASVTEDSQGYGQCSWVEVGYDKSHEQIVEWCEPGAFITQLDLSGGESPAGSWPVVGQALCCTP